MGNETHVPLDPRHVVNLINMFRQDSKHNVQAMYEECPFYAYIARFKDPDWTLRTTVNYDRRVVTFDFHWPHHFRLTGEFVKQGGDGYDPEQGLIVGFLPNLEYAGAWARVDLSKMTYELKLNPKDPKSTEKAVADMLAKITPTLQERHPFPRRAEGNGQENLA